jgi:hypothetical protein
MAIRKNFTQCIIPVIVTILFFIINLLHCNIPGDPTLEPENVSISVIETGTSKEIAIGDSLKIKVAVYLPDLVDSVQIKRMDSVYITLQKITDTFTVSVLPLFPGKFSFTIKGYCQRSVVKEASGNCIVKNVPIAILSEPQSVTTVENSPVEFTILATGEPVPSIQWFRDSVAINGATNDTLKIPNVSAAMNGCTFRVRLANSVDTLWSKPAVLTVSSMVYMWDVMLWDNALWH